MSEQLETSERNPVDLAYFGLIFSGLLVAVAGMVILSVRVVLLGAVIAATGFIHFTFAE